jgi:OmpA-OmpF porin, OOP family
VKNISKRPNINFLFLSLAIATSAGAYAQQQMPENKDIIVNGQQQPEVDPNAAIASATPVKGPEIRGIISARNGDRMQITADDGSKTIVSFNDATKIRSRKGLFGLGRSKLATDALLNGLPVTIKTVQMGDQLMASQINMRNNDLKTASMIRTGTAQGFAEQTAATEALRGRMSDIDQYNIKGTTNVNFATGKAVLSEQGKANLCATVSAAESMKNAQLLVVGYTDSVGSQEYNQQLSEKRASRVVNHLQQACGWKPYRMLTPTGMAEADPLASNDTSDGKAQNRRVSVNILVSKGLDGL